MGAIFKFALICSPPLSPWLGSEHNEPRHSYVQVHYVSLLSQGEREGGQNGGKSEMCFNLAPPLSPWLRSEQNEPRHSYVEVHYVSLLSQGEREGGQNEGNIEVCLNLFPPSLPGSEVSLMSLDTRGSIFALTEIQGYSRKFHLHPSSLSL